jgi:hypothetical protein
MKSKSGYQIKKPDTAKIAGGPSFQIRSADDDPQMSNEEWEAERKGWERYLRETPQGRVWRERAKKANQRLRGV